MEIHLTPREEEVMQILWRLKNAFVKEIIEEMSLPKPPYNTISSVVRKLEDRELVGHEAFGKTHRYFPILKEKEYRKFALKRLMSNYFSGSYEQIVSFFVKEENVKMEDLEELLNKMKPKDEDPS